MDKEMPQMTVERAIEILDPTHREHYDSIDVVNEACKMGMEALALKESMTQRIAELEAEVERLQKSTEEAVSCFTRMESLYKIKCKELEVAKSEAYREFGEKITETFLRYAHLHSHADCARKDYIKAADGTEIEMQSVWDAFTLEKYGMAVYEDMNRLQTNIELIEKDRLLTELEKDSRLRVKELTESNE